MSKDTGFIEYARKDPAYRPVDERLKDFNAVERRMTDADLNNQAARCMDCGVPFCHNLGCPLGNVIPEFNDHVYNGRWQEAFDILQTTNPFPEFTGRICPAPCEGSCVLGLKRDPVTIRELELAIIEKAFERGYIEPRPPPQRAGRRVAVVGSGPAGLAAAWVLNRAGCHVTVYEDAAHAGGILRYGIPNFKLEKWVVERRVRLMQEEGVVFETGVRVGRDISHRYLTGRHHAIVLTGGAQHPRDLAVPGRGLKGIHFAMEYLVQQNQLLSREAVDPAAVISARDKAVVIIGGGDTGSDCLGTALRQGARQVNQFEILPRPPPVRSPETPWPLWPNMLRESSSHKEGGQRRWCVATVALEGQAGRVGKLRGVGVEWKAPQPGARPAPVPQPGTEFSVAADLILLAMGFDGPGRNPLVDELKIQLNSQGFIQVDANKMTSVPGVFAAGDMARGASLVVRAIQEGKEAAAGVQRYLA